MPGIAWKRAASSRTIARRSSSAGEPETIASATFGPTPFTRQELHEELALGALGEAVQLHARPRGRAGTSRPSPRRRRPPCAARSASRRRGSRRRRRRARARRASSATGLPRRRAITCSADHLQERRCERVADRDGERVGGVVRRRQRLQPEDRLHHPLHLRLLGAAVAAHRLLDARGRVLGALDAGSAAATSTAPRACPTESAMRASTPTNDSSRATASGACSTMSAATPSKIVFSRSSSRSPAGVDHAPVADGPEAPAAFVDDPVPASSRPRIDADDLHADTLGMRSDNSFLAGT